MICCTIDAPDIDKCVNVFAKTKIIKPVILKTYSKLASNPFFEVLHFYKRNRTKWNRVGNENREC